VRGLFWLCLFSVIAASAAPNKPIRLRNQIVQSQAAAQILKPDSTPRSGLFLIQFRDSLQPQWREQLRTLGVDLLRYVPDDAFVARFEKVQTGDVQALGFVQQIVPYQAAHKVHTKLQAAKASVESLQVAVLLSPRANDAETAQTQAHFAEVRSESKLRSGRVIRGRVSPAQLDALAASDTVLWIEPAPDMKLFDEVASKIVAGDGGPNLLDTQALGYDGSGVNVAVADSGLNNGDAVTMHPDLLGRTPAFFYYGTPGQLTDTADEHSHGTHVAGIIAGNGATGEVDTDGNLYGLGVAPGANIIAQRIFDGVGNYAAPPSFEKLTRDAKRAGADIGSNSWGDDTQGRYDTSAMEFDELVRDADALTLGDQPYILEFSAGNAGPGQQTIGSPAVAKNVIATGASQNDRLDQVIYADGIDAMADFSSRGPCEDGRIKPDVVAPGTWIASLQSESATDQYAWAPISPNYQFQGGTSQAGPHVSGAAAVFVQFYRATHNGVTPSPALVKAALINSAVDMDDASGTGPTPNMDEGWGRVDLTQIMDSVRSVDYVDQSAPLTNGQIFERTILIASRAEPLKVTLTYTDEPGFPGAIPALVNDLDLEVVAPDGSVYRGNQFDQGRSVANAPGHDNINNVEGVFIASPVPGEYLLRVRARNVVADARADTGVVDQDFALVTSGLLAAPGTSVIFLDRNAYRAPGTIKITVFDQDHAGNPSATVLVRSTTETLGENYLLNAADGGGTFTGSVATLTGPAVTDAKLQVAHNDTIEVRYFDASVGSNQTATARVDLVAPVITNVTSTNEFGYTLITWTTDEPANSIVRFNTNATLSHAVTNSALTTDHAVAVIGLTANQTYFFHVASTDEAGNSATNNNGGALYMFVAPTVSSVLLVDAYYNDLFDVPPLSGWTTPLTQLGITYDVWNKQSRGSPAFTNLLPYRVIIWRVAEFPFDANNLGWTAPEQNALADYLRAGGSLFTASMELLTRLEEGGFPNARLGMLHVQSYVVDNDPNDVPDTVGASYDPLGSGINLALDYTPYEDPIGFKDLLGLPADVSDTFTPDSVSEAVFFDNFGEVTGLKYPRTGLDSTGRVVFLSFPFDTVPTDGTTNNRVQLLRNILEFLLPGFDGRATVSLDQPAYPIPGLVVVEVADADLAGSGSLNVTCSSTTQPSATSLTLTETARRGIFRGTIQLVSPTNAPVAGKLRAKNGDMIQVNYADASSGTTEHASATVDTLPPSISGVSAEPDYDQATISWTTTELSDSLVQYGESQFLDHSTGNALPTTSHTVILPGLQPDTLYYFQVVSRDAAGNPIVDDNHTNLFTFHTLAPIVPPWSDNLNTGATNWTTFNNDGSQSSWTLGTPANGMETNAHSPPKCWASNLNGDSLDYTETFLISPAIYLSGGNSARLTFWHSYDFSEQSSGDIFEAGTLYIVTGSGSQSTELAQYVDTNFEWEPESIDLSPYAGQVVYFVWAHQLISLDSAPRPGWLVDDVSVTITNVAGGTINVTNNLWQAKFVLSGPVYKVATGTSLRLANAPPGEYTLEYADVPYYNTPPAQTNTLNSGGTLNFTGNYTFSDANTNGIPDGWELANFGSLSFTRTSATDTDADGMSDYAEFVAGTDPNNPPPPFRVTVRRLANGLVNLSWPSVTNQAYRIQATPNLPATTWEIYSGWLGATGTNTSFTLPAPTNGTPRFFRVEAASPGGAGTPAGLFRATGELLVNGLVRLEWPSAPGHGYRILGSANATNWSPFSDWIRASGFTTGLTLPSRTNGAPFLFRIEAQP
jgi:hypothetical protein